MKQEKQTNKKNRRPIQEAQRLRNKSDKKKKKTIGKYLLDKKYEEIRIGGMSFQNE